MFLSEMLDFERMFERSAARWDTQLSHLMEKPLFSVRSDLVSVDRSHRLALLEANQ